MACGCNKGAAAAAAASVQTYEITGDPQAKKYLTERDALNAKVTRQLEGAVVPVQ